MNALNISHAGRSIDFPLKVARYTAHNKWIWRYILIPWCINIVVLFVFWIAFFRLINNVLFSFEILSDVSGLIATSINVILFLFTILIGVLVFYSLATIIAAPFNSMMVEKMMIKAGIIKRSEASMIKDFIDGVKYSIKYEIIKTIILLLVFSISLLIGVVPVVGVFIAGFVTYFGNIFLSLVDFFDPVLSLSRYEVKERFVYVKDNIHRNIGLAIITGIAIYLPILNIFYIPFAVIGATLSHLENDRK